MYGLDPITGLCAYSTPCGWCCKWDKKCDKKIGCSNEKPQRGLRVKINPIDDALDSTDAMSVIDQAIDEIELLENIHKVDRYSDSVYNSFRKEVCNYCNKREMCLRSKIAIIECSKFENYYEV
jgi:hypothetical protein